MTQIVSLQLTLDGSEGSRRYWRYTARGSDGAGSSGVHSTTQLSAPFFRSPDEEIALQTLAYNLGVDLRAGVTSLGLGVASWAAT